MKLSIITINLNNKAGLQKTIDSVIAQTCKDFEWIVIDGGSTDGSKELIKEYADEISYWVSEPDNGIYNAMNKGIRVARGEYFLFLNSGDYFYNNDVVYNVLPLLIDYDFYVGGISNDTGDIWDKPLLTTEDICFNYFSIPHQSTFIARRIFDKYGLYCEEIQISSDWYLFHKALMLGDATVCRLSYIIAVFAANGISQTHVNLRSAEYDKLWSETPRVRHIVNIYLNNYKFVKALKANRFLFFIFRIYYYVYRHISK